MDDSKTCTKCQSAKARAEFYGDKKTGDRLTHHCKSCMDLVTRRNQARMAARGYVAVPELKQCGSCRETKPAADFHRNATLSDGLFAKCKICYKATRAARLPSARPSSKTCIKCQVAKPAADFAPDKRNASGIQSACRVCDNARRYAYAASGRGYQLKCQSNHRRRVQTRSAPSDVTPEAWASVLEQFGNRCAYCLVESTELQIDHVHPVNAGGLHLLENVVPACIRCNGSKCDRTLLQCLADPRLLVTQQMLKAS